VHSDNLDPKATTANDEPDGTFFDVVIDSDGSEIRGRSTAKIIAASKKRKQ